MLFVIDYYQKLVMILRKIWYFFYVKNSRAGTFLVEKVVSLRDLPKNSWQIRCRRIFQEGRGVPRVRWLSAHINQCLSVAHCAYNTVMSSKGLDIFAGGSRPRTSRSFLHTSLTLSTQFSFLRTQLSSGFSRQSSGFRKQFIRERNNIDFLPVLITANKYELTDF